MAGTALQCSEAIPSKFRAFPALEEVFFFSYVFWVPGRGVGELVKGPAKSKKGIGGDCKAEICSNTFTHPRGRAPRKESDPELPFRMSQASGLCMGPGGSEADMSKQ